jgi:hypothetical protein
VCQLGLNGLIRANRVIAEAELVELLGFQQVAAVEEEGGLVHVLIDGRKVERAELVPLREDRDGVGPIGSRGAEEATSAFAVNSLSAAGVRICDAVCGKWIG